MKAALKEVKVFEETRTNGDSNGDSTIDQKEEKKKKVIPSLPVPNELIYTILNKEGSETPVIDIGANLTKAGFKDSIHAILGRASKAGVTHIKITEPIIIHLVKQ